jgi:hypothetical protein
VKTQNTKKKNTEKRFLIKLKMAVEIKMADYSSPIFLKRTFFSFFKRFYFQKKAKIIEKKAITQKFKMAAENQKGGKSAFSY